MKPKHQAYTIGTFFLLAGAVALLFYFGEGDQGPYFFGIGYLGWYALALLIVGLDAFIVGFFLRD